MKIKIKLLNSLIEEHINEKEYTELKKQWSRNKYLKFKRYEFINKENIEYIKVFE